MVTTMNNDYYDLFEAATIALKNFKTNWIDGITIDTPYPKNGTEYYYRLENGVEKKVDESEFGILQEEVKAIYEELDLEHDGKINSLEDYFSVLKTLSLSFDTNYQILPIDEPTFGIDLNTRSIQFPKGNYVYAVVGDDLAETIYFKTDRYFDNVDLNDMTIAIIVNTGEKKYLIPTNVRDITSDPGKIIFGWPISKEITENSTTLEFAVRFYTFNEKQELAYNLSTQTNKLIVKPGLNYKTNEVNDLSTVSNRVANLLKNYNKLGTAAVLPPEFYYCSYGFESGQANLKGEKEGEKKLKLFAGAKTTEDTLLYSWKRSDTIGGTYDIAPGETNDTDYYKLDAIKEDDIKLHPVFYTEKDGIYKEEILSSENDVVQGRDYYRRGSSYIATSPGFYYCVAKAKNKLRENSSTTATLEIPAPVKLSFQENIQNKIMLTTDKNPIKLKDLQTKYGNLYIKDDSTIDKYIGNVEIVCKKESNLINSDLTAGSYEIYLKNTLNNADKESDPTTLIIYDPIDIPSSLEVKINNEPLNSESFPAFENVDNLQLNINLGNNKRNELTYTYRLLHQEQATGEEEVITESKSITLDKGIGVYQLEIYVSTDIKDFENKDIESAQKIYNFVINNNN